jgi:hypothetical protein
MVKKIIQLAALSILMAACGKKTEEKRAEISFAMKNFRAESSAGCKNDSLHCASYEVNYPDFKGLDSAVERRIKQKMDATVSMGNPEAEGKSMQEIADGFIKDYEDFIKELPDESGGWYYNADVTVEVMTDTLISLSSHEEYFTGGAHGGSGTYFINVRPSTGATFTLDNFFKDGYMDPLTKIGEEVFRQVKEIPDTASLNENYFEFPDDKFQLNQNYGFRKEGVVFYYNSYEIAPYAAGPTEVLIPYERIRDWMK